MIVVGVDVHKHSLSAVAVDELGRQLEVWEGTYLERKQAEGKSRREALRCLKRQLARTVYTTLKNEAHLT